MIVFPPSAAVTVVIDGAPVRTYQPAVVRQGRTYAPVHPFLTSAAACVWTAGSVLNVRRNGRSVSVRTSGYVQLAPIFRALGASVTYVDRRVIVRFPRAPVAAPTPFSAAFPQVTPHAVFTPIPVETARPVWNGSPLPRRTPIPMPAPTPG